MLSPLRLVRRMKLLIMGLDFENLVGVPPHALVGNSGVAHYAVTKGLAEESDFIRPAARRKFSDRLGITMSTGGFEKFEDAGRWSVFTGHLNK